MKNPLYALLIARDAGMRADIIAGRKCISVREGHRDYRPGPVMLCCHLEPWVVMADVTGVRHCMLGEVTREEWEADGFTSFQHMWDALRVYYPYLLMTSPITVIRWAGARGALV